MSEQYFVEPSNYVTVSNMDGTIEEYINRNADKIKSILLFDQSIVETIELYNYHNKDKIKNMLLSNELKKKRCKVSKTFRDHYNKRDILRLKH